VSGLTWSPDGTRLAFAQEGRLFVMNADGSRLHPVSPATSNAQLVDPTWSPDGRTILFSSDSEGTFEVYRADLDARRVSRVTTCRTRACERSWGDLSPSWSPDGSRVVFERNLHDIDVMRSDGTHIRPLVRCRVLPCERTSPAWSPRGDEIVFQRSPREVWVIRPDGTGAHRLFSCEKADCLAVLDPTWSPDGTRLTFTLITPDIARHVAVIDADGRDLRVLTSSPPDACCPAWQPVAGSPIPSVSRSPSPSSTGTLTRLLGPHCDLTKGSGDFDGDGRQDVAYVYERRPRGGCPTPGMPNPDPHRLTVIFGSGMRVDRPLPECDFACWVFAVPDLNRDGTDELAITVQEGASTVTFDLFAYLSGRFDPLELRPPGTKVQGPGPIHFTWYGSVTHEDFFRCRTAAAGDHLVVEIAAGTGGRRWHVTETVFEFDGTAFAFRSERHLTARVRAHDDPFSAPNEMCGAPLGG